jgi:hypothetical protein
VRAAFHAQPKVCVRLTAPVGTSPARLGSAAQGLLQFAVQLDPRPRQLVHDALCRAAQSLAGLSRLGPAAARGRRLHLPHLFVFLSCRRREDRPQLIRGFRSVTPGIAILQTLSYRLYDPDPQALRGVLAGTAPVVLPLARTAGATAEEIKVEEGVWRAGGGRIYGIEEAGLMACLREGEIEWKGARAHFAGLPSMITAANHVRSLALFRGLLPATRPAGTRLCDVMQSPGLV